MESVVTAHELAVLEKEPVWSLSLGLHCRSNTRSGITRRGVLRRRWKRSHLLPSGEILSVLRQRSRAVSLPSKLDPRW